MDDLKIKVYGFVRTTKKQFLIIEMSMMVVFVVAMIFTIFYYNGPITKYSSDYDIFMTRYGFLIWLFFILWVIIESQFFIHRFTKAHLKIIEKQKEEIQQQKEEILTQKDEIETQRDLVLEQKEHIEEIHLELSQSIDYATRLQKSILPVPEILRDNLSDFFVLFKPKDKVSGDFYWWSHNEGITVITAADCTGHGVPGAFMSMLGVSFLREIVLKEFVTQPGIILQKLRKEIIRTLNQKESSKDFNVSDDITVKDGMDMALVSIDHKRQICCFSGANNPLYLIRKTDAEPFLTEYKADKMPIAVYDKMDNYKEVEISLQKGDWLYMFSDGFADQFGGSLNKKYLYKRFKEFLINNVELSGDDQKAALEKEFDLWRGENEQIDDVVVLGIRI